MRSELLLLRIPEFYAPELCASLSARIIEIVKTQSTATGKICESDVDSFFSTLGNVEARSRYLETAVRNMQLLRRSSHPYPDAAFLVKRAMVDFCERPFSRDDS